jgi:lycopene cyclase domain-containing protein
MSEYFFILLLFLAIALFLEWQHKIHLYKNRRERFEITILFLAIGIIWDTIAISRGHWIFPEGSNLGIRIGLIPLEEYMFYLVIPYFSFTVYKVIDNKYRKERKR